MAAASATGSAASLRARCATRAGRSVSGEAHLRRLALGVVLDLEELPLGEAERVGEDHGREGLDRVVEGEHRVVVDLARDGDLVLGVAELVLQVEEVLVRLQLRVGLGDGEQPAERLAEDALRLRGRGGPCACCAAARASVTASNVPRSWAA